MTWNWGLLGFLSLRSMSMGLGLGWSFLLTTSFYFAFCLLSSTLLTPVREEGTEREVVPLSFSSYQDSDWSVYPDHPQNATTFFLSTLLILVCLLLFHYLFDYVVWLRVCVRRTSEEEWRVRRVGRGEPVKMKRSLLTKVYDCLWSYDTNDPIYETHEFPCQFLSYTFFLFSFLFSLSGFFTIYSSIPFTHFFRLLSHWHLSPPHELLEL